MKWLVLFVFLLASSALEPVKGDTIIETISSWGGNNVYALGEPGTATRGQTFTVDGTDTVLNSLTFFLRNRYSSSSGYTDFVEFGMYVMEWDGWKATGPILFESDMLSTTILNTEPDEWEEFTVDTGGTRLALGREYVAFLSTSQYFDGEAGKANMGLAGTGTVYADADVYPGGHAVWQDNEEDFSLLTSQEWDHWTGDVSSGWDHAFSLTLVPEPSTLVLLVAAALGFLANSRRQRRAKVEPAR